MSFQHKIRQLQNLAYQAKQVDKPMKWLYIHGLPRSGTSFTLRQFMLISRQGIGDWMMHEVAETYHNIEVRERQHLNMNKLYTDMKRNILENAPVGGGSAFDFVVKQANGKSIEVEFWTRIFQNPPHYILFLYREPDGWYSSASEKFHLNEKENIELYAESLRGFTKIGGVPIEYGEGINDYLKTLPEFQDKKILDFNIKRKEVQKAPAILHEYYEEFTKELVKNQALAV